MPLLLFSRLPVINCKIFFHPPFIPLSLSLLSLSLPFVLLPRLRRRRLSVFFACIYFGGFFYADLTSALFNIHIIEKRATANRRARYTFLFPTGAQKGRKKRGGDLYTLQRANFCKTRSSSARQRVAEIAFGKHAAFLPWPRARGVSVCMPYLLLAMVADDDTAALVEVVAVVDVSDDDDVVVLLPCLHVCVSRTEAAETPQPGSRNSLECTCANDPWRCKKAERRETSSENSRTRMAKCALLRSF